MNIQTSRRAFLTGLIVAVALPRMTRAQAMPGSFNVLPDAGEDWVPNAFIRVAPEKIRMGPNSPSERAQARVAAVSTPRLASGNTTSQNAWLREHPSVRATCSCRGLICSKVARMVLTAKAQATMN